MGIDIKTTGKWAIADPNTVDGYEFRLGEFGVECRHICGKWYWIDGDDRPEVIAAAREWMRRRGFKLGGES